MSIYFRIVTIGFVEKAKKLNLMPSAVETKTKDRDLGVLSQGDLDP